jgi:hypothetical protein
MNNLNNILDYLKVFNNIDKNPEPRFMAQGGRPGYKRGSTIAMQKPVEFYVDIVRNMIQDTTYTPPVNINAREVGTIPNFQKAKELVKADVGESFDVLYNRNVQKRKKIKRAEDPIKKEKDLISKAERKSKRRVLKADPSDPVKMTDREQALNFEQRKHNRDLNLKIRQNPDLILKDKSLMDKLSTTVSKDGNIIKVKPTLDDIKNRGIVEVEHQRDIFKKGKLKDLPYNRNFILGPYNREGGFKKMAETFIEKNPDANNIKVKNIIKKAKELGVTLQPNVPKGTFPTKGIGYKQVGGPVEKFANAAAHSLQGSKLNLSSKKPVRSFLGKTFRTLGTPLSGLGFAGWTAYDNLKAGKGLTDSVVDPLVGGELLFPSLFVENVAKITKSPTLQKILGLGKFGSRVMPVTGTAITLAGLTKDATQEIMNESRRIDAIENPDQQLAEQDMLVRNIKGYADGGRISFGKGSKGPKDPSRRAFIKGVSALAMLPIVGKYFKLAAPATKAVGQYTGPVIEKIKGLEWVQFLAKRLWDEGADVTETAARQEREIVKRGTLESGDDVDMVYNLDSGDVRFEVSPVKGSRQTSGGAYNDPYSLDYKAPQVIDEGKQAGTKIKSEIEVAESRPVQTDPETVELDGDYASVDDAISDLTELEAFAKKKLTKEIHKAKGTKPKNVVPDPDLPDYPEPDLDDFASGGRVSYFDGGIVSLKKKW